MNQDVTHRYPVLPLLKSILYSVIELGLLYGGVHFLIVDKPEAWQAWVFMPIILMGITFGVVSHIRMLFDHSVTIRTTEQGLCLARFNKTILTIAWPEITRVRPKGTQGGIWMDVHSRKKPVSIDYSISNLDVLKDVIRSRVSNWE